MATKSIAWTTGNGNILLTYTGQGNGTIQVSSDENNLDVSRSQNVTVKTTKGGTITRTLAITQAAGPNFRLANGDVYKTADNDYYNVKTE